MNTFSTFTVFAWMPVLLTEVSGIPAANTGWLLGLFPLITVPLALVLPWFLERLSRQDLIVHVFGIFMAAGWGGLLFLPHVAPLAWVVSIGVAAGLFVIQQVLVVLRTRDHPTTAKVSGYSLTVGYLFGATGPLLVGLLLGWTGTWTAPLAVMFGSTVLVFAAGWLLRDGNIISGAIPSAVLSPTGTLIQQSTRIGES
jgi:CP family cyanate transporter-like MFS transporter